MLMILVLILNVFSLLIYCYLLLVLNIYLLENYREKLRVHLEK